MKNIFTIICLSLLLECGKDIPKEWKKINYSICKTVNTSDSISMRYFYTLITKIEQSQNEVLFSENPRSIKKLVNQAFDTATGCFYTVGKGTINHEIPDEAQNAKRKSEAKLEGYQWAFCLKAWNSGITASRNKPQSGQIYYSKSLYEKKIEDTLFVLFEIPSGSICLTETPNNESQY